MENLRVFSGESITPSLLQIMKIADTYLHSFEEIVEINDNAPGIDNLKRFLSIRSVLSTTSSFQVRQQEARDKKTSCEKIGEGFCAEVFDLPGSGRVVKRARQGATKAAELWQDFGSHLRIYESFTNKEVAGGIDISVPKPSYFVTAGDFADWAATHDFQARGNQTETHQVYKQPSSILVSERIMPLPKVIRTALIDTFCPDADRKHALADPKNNDCIVRIYLGVRRRDPVHCLEAFSLRNFELTLDRMDHIGIDPEQFVAPMAEALAVMHWDARRDAGDVEFVLGSAPESRITARDFDHIDKEKGMQTTWQNPKRMLQDSLDFSRRTVSMWLLDFNNVSRIIVRDSDIEKLTDAFWENDPYFPRPGQELWGKFKMSYLVRSEKIMETSALPQRFLDMVEKKAQARRTSVGEGPPKAASSAPPAAHDLNAPMNAAKKGKKPRKYAGMD